jgi:hypothetical protein
MIAVSLVMMLLQCECIFYCRSSVNVITVYKYLQSWLADEVQNINIVSDADVIEGNPVKFNITFDGRLVDYLYLYKHIITIGILHYEQNTWTVDCHDNVCLIRNKSTSCSCLFLCCLSYLQRYHWILLSNTLWLNWHFSIQWCYKILLYITMQQWYQYT